MDSGIYIVTLNNSEPISVNANDPRIAEKAIKVTKANCKFGKAKSLKARDKNYFRTFGEHNVNLVPVALVEDFAHAEKTVLSRLDQYRIRGRTGRKNEWLEGVSVEEVLEVVLETLEGKEISHVHVIPRYEGDVPDPRGGIRNIIPAKAAYCDEKS